MTTLKCWKVLEADGYYRSFIEKKSRPDGREWMKERPVTLKVGSITTAEGSATVRVGNTSVVCGIKAEIAVPDLRSCDRGFIVPNVELYPCSSPLFKAGPPGEKALVMSKFLSDIIRSSNLIDLKTLCIVPNKVAWCLYCDIVCLDYDGNLGDASLLALVAALENTRLPLLTWDADFEKISVPLENTEKLQLNATPTCTTFTLYGSDVYLLDPTAEDEAEGNGEVTIVLKDSKSLCSVHKSGGEFLPPEVMEKFIQIAMKRAEDLKKIITDATRHKKT